MDRYRLIEPLGTGGMSVVWRAFDEILERPVAVKLLAPKLLADPASRRRIQAEARAAALLSHPNIAQVYDFGHGPDGAPYVVMELVTGRSLEDAGPLPPVDVVRIGAQLASALAAVHARGLVHRDVKPANVMLTDGGAKLVDFGISAIAGDHSDLGDEILGTPAYLAPERLRGRPTTAATDVYALGMLLYRALADRFPWPDELTTTGVLEAHRRVRPEPLPPRLVPKPVAEAVARCLAKWPENRPSAAELQKMLLAAVPRMPRPRARGTATVAAPARATRGVTTRAASIPLPRTGRGRLTAAGVVAAAAVSGLAMCSPGEADGDPTWVAAAAAPAAPATQAPAAADCAVQYSVRSERNGAFTADLQLSVAPAPAAGWSLTFRVPDGQNIAAIDGATWHQDSGQVLISGADVAADLAGGAQFAISGAYRDTSALPTDFALNGAACRSVLLAPAATQVPAATPPTTQPPAPTKAPVATRATNPFGGSDHGGGHRLRKKKGPGDD
ncbi:serine/threonine-protein kinase [Dactylosporangium sp. CA-092794]|uniref:serine/threonine-protein kinase n=1 Tax=Dactylosporangium sp. CA-092794 TaxID=3239929 RepID=UPI003D8BA172